MSNEGMTHPDILSAEQTGYPRQWRGPDVPELKCYSVDVVATVNVEVVVHAESAADAKRKVTSSVVEERIRQWTREYDQSRCGQTNVYLDVRDFDCGQVEEI